MENNIQIIIRQTNYNENEAKEKMQKHNNNHIKVIEEYMGISHEKENKPIVSVNQEKYKQFRNLMEEGYNNYRKNKLNEK